MRKKKIIIAPLNWGIGHATRCIPIIDHILRLNINIVIASDGDTLKLLKQLYPKLESYELPSYSIKYGIKNALSPFIYRWPLIVIAIIKEYFALKNILSQHEFIGVISDNRLGFFNSKVPSYYITHQTNILIQNNVLSAIANCVHGFFMDKYKQVWVPDIEGENSLSGKLSSSSKSLNKQYIGSLSRLHPKEQEKIRDFIVVLSGIESQRSILEQKLRKLLEKSNYTFLIVKGKITVSAFDDCTIGYLGGADLSKEIGRSNYVISRAGYSSIMDWVALGAKALIIPTPGQTEQEYLSKHLADHPQFVCQKQNAINLDKVILNFKEKYKIPPSKNNSFNLKLFLEKTFQ